MFEINTINKTDNNLKQLIQNPELEVFNAIGHKLYGTATATGLDLLAELAKELEDNNKNIDFVFLSLDRSREGFEKSMERFEMKDKENYWFSSGWKNDFNNYIDLNWIPRYMVIDQKSAIAKYYAISPEDPDIQATIDTLLK